MCCQQCDCKEFHRQPPTSNHHHQTAFRLQFLFSLSTYIHKVESAYKTTLDGVSLVKNELKKEESNRQKFRH